MQQKRNENLDDLKCSPWSDIESQELFNFYYKPSPKVIDLVSFMYQKIFYNKCFTIYWHGGHCKVGLGQHRIIICDDLVEPTFPMLHAMSQTHWSFDFRDDFKWRLPCMGVVAILVM